MGINAQIPANLDFSRFAGVFTIFIGMIVYKKIMYPDSSGDGLFLP